MSEHLGAVILVPHLCLNLSDPDIFMVANTASWASVGFSWPLKCFFEAQSAQIFDKGTQGAMPSSYGIVYVWS